MLAYLSVESGWNGPKSKHTSKILGRRQRGVRRYSCRVGPSFALKRERTATGMAARSPPRRMVDRLAQRFDYGLVIAQFVQRMAAASQVTCSALSTQVANRDTV